MKWIYITKRIEVDLSERNNTWKSLEKSKEINVIGLKWIYKTKANMDGPMQKYKATLVAKGYS